MPSIATVETALKLVTAQATDVETKDRLVVFQTHQGSPGQGHLLRLSRQSVCFEVYGPDSVLRTSEALQGFQIFARGQIIYAGRAVVRDLMNAGSAVVCEADLDESGFDAEFVSSVARPSQLGARFDDFVREWQEVCQVRPEFKVAVADVQTFLMDLRRWVEHVELGLHSAPASSRTSLEDETIEKLRGPVVALLDQLFAKFEESVRVLDETSLPRHRRYAQRLLHPIVLCAPFADRTYQKPLGYAGDYEMVNMILRDPKEGGSLFAKLFNVWLLHQASAAAHRNRLEFLRERLIQEALRCRRVGRPVRILNLGCGPACEVQKFLAEDSLADDARFALLDFNDETVNYTTRVLGELCRRHGRRTQVEVSKKSVQQVLKESSRSLNGAHRDYDFIYCSGLFDYLSDRTCKELMNLFWKRTRPGGLVLATNITPHCPNRRSLEMLLDWHLIYRDAPRFAAFAPKGAEEEDVRLYSDDTGVNIILEARKPDV